VFPAKKRAEPYYHEVELQFYEIAMIVLSPTEMNTISTIMLFHLAFEEQIIYK
jgi:hypothetical protein